jgi:hypothetical protein
MRRKILGFILVLFSVSNFARADVPTIETSFERAFYDIGDTVDGKNSVHTYVPLWCPQNIARLLLRLSADGVDLSEAKVLFLLPKAQMAIYPVEARAADGASAVAWAFHVVLLVQDRILDLDFTDKPEPVEIESYFLDMWQKVPVADLSSTEPVLIQEFSAADYRLRFSGDWKAFLAAGTHLAEPQDATQWLIDHAH